LALDVKAGLGMRDLKAWTILETIAKNDSPGDNNLVCTPLLFSQDLKWFSRSTVVILGNSFSFVYHWFHLPSHFLPG